MSLIDLFADGADQNATDEQVAIIRRMSSEELVARAVQAQERFGEPQVNARDWYRMNEELTPGLQKVLRVFLMRNADLLTGTWDDEHKKLVSVSEPQAA